MLGIVEVTEEDENVLILEESTLLVVNELDPLLVEDEEEDLSSEESAPSVAVELDSLFVENEEEALMVAWGHVVIPAAEVWPDPCELILEFCEDSRVDEEVDEVVSISVANSVVIIELTMVVDCWVIVKSDVYVAFAWTAKGILDPGSSLIEMSGDSIQAEGAPRVHARPARKTKPVVVFILKFVLIV
ncbi:predicted protein [Sclerotinia sclerotiorum 1980 UF-70]|uniref:Uncharacterized protein n=1 Tax=Sclerotinia sclerotiorum (strain ATCC 18683 / 1980 / Ss-1) TaxID=665079 RepID=A7F2H3_SCLS1|nr:predicted protein [Sclerotinia sclerotiorum 1980 UF-70]EDN95915.1 predicted protein [Sclerotinia sclerotiorum 1980 UF-70]